MAAFCERLCWTDYSTLFMRITEKINWQVKEELLDLMQLPSLRPERARTMYSNGITTVEQLAQGCSAEQLVKLFSKNEGFVTHRESNAEDLQLKYDFLYSFSHKVISEAKAIMVKRKYDPDQTTNNYLNGGAVAEWLAGSDFVIVSDSEDSDSSSEEESEPEALEVPSESEESLGNLEALLPEDSGSELDLGDL